MLLEMSSQTAKRANMSEEKLKKALTKSLDDLKAVETKLEIKLGPKSVSERKHEFLGVFRVTMYLFFLIGQQFVVGTFLSFY